MAKCKACGAQEEVSEDLLDAFEADLFAPVPPVGTPQPAAAPARPPIGRGLVEWPMEIRRGIAGYLPWREVLAAGWLCRAWRALEQDIPLWSAHFALTWPLGALRQAERTRGPQDWRQLFRARWLSGDQDGDATAEDWRDFYAAQEVVRKREHAAAAILEVPSPAAHAARLRHAMDSCRTDVLSTFGVQVPKVADKSHLCSHRCRFHRLPNSGDSFVCQVSGILHQCHVSIPCGTCVVSSDGCFLVCPASGKAYDRPDAFINEDAREDAELWDTLAGEPEGTNARWVEQGYGMDEEQAEKFFSSF